jgi:hypothetical protein
MGDFIMKMTKSSILCAIEANGNAIDICVHAMHELNKQNPSLLEWNKWALRFAYYDKLSERLLNENKEYFKQYDGREI